MPILRLRRYRASSSYLPEQLHHRRNWEFHRYCARSSYLAIALVNIRAMALRGHRASSSCLPGFIDCTVWLLTRRYCASSSYLPLQMGPLLTRELCRCRVFCTRLPLSRESEGARGPRENDTSSIAISNFNVCRIMRFIDTSLRAAACSELLNSRGVYFAGNALRAAAYRNGPQLI